MKNIQPVVEAGAQKIPCVVPELSAALSTGMFHPIGGLDPDMNRGPRDSKPRLGFWSRFRTTRS